MKKLEEYPGYLASDDGRIWSCWRTGYAAPKGPVYPPRPLKANATTHYASVQLLDRQGARVRRYVHRLVLEAFIGPAPEGQEGRHLNGDRMDNRIDNLAWSTHAENCADRMIHGTAQNMNTKGERNGRAKLTADQVRLIRFRRSMGSSTVALGLEYGVSSVLISRICLRKAWRHV